MTGRVIQWLLARYRLNSGWHIELKTCFLYQIFPKLLLNYFGTCTELVLDLLLETIVYFICECSPGLKWFIFFSKYRSKYEIFCNRAVQIKSKEINDKRVTFSI